MRVFLSWLIARLLEVSIGGLAVVAMLDDPSLPFGRESVLLGAILLTIGYMITGFGPLTLWFTNKFRDAPGRLVVANLALGIALALGGQALLSVTFFPGFVSILFHCALVAASTMVGLALVRRFWPRPDTRSD